MKSQCFCGFCELPCWVCVDVQISFEGSGLARQFCVLPSPVSRFASWTLCSLFEQSLFSPPVPLLPYSNYVCFGSLWNLRSLNLWFLAPFIHLLLAMLWLLLGQQVNSLSGAFSVSHVLLPSDCTIIHSTNFCRVLYLTGEVKGHSIVTVRRPPPKNWQMLPGTLPFRQDSLHWINKGDAEVHGAGKTWRGGLS